MYCHSILFVQVNKKKNKSQNLRRGRRSMGSCLSVLRESVNCRMNSVSWLPHYFSIVQCTSKNDEFECIPVQLFPEIYLLEIDHRCSSVFLSGKLRLTNIPIRCICRFIEAWLGNDLVPTEWKWKNSDHGLLTTETPLPPAPSQGLKLISCDRQEACSPAYVDV